MEIKWINVLIFIFIHIAAVYGFIVEKKTSTLIVGWTFGVLSGLGTTVAAHRYYTHKTFKANKILKFILLTMQTMSAQEPVLHWARDHRVHHKCNLSFLSKIPCLTFLNLLFFSYGFQCRSI
jgi:stearoyl-CoA desaturase (Delta-9 desaturase)